MASLGCRPARAQGQLIDDSGSTCHEEARSRSFFTSSSVRRCHGLLQALGQRAPPTRLCDQELERHTAELTSQEDDKQKLHQSEALIRVRLTHGSEGTLHYWWSHWDRPVNHHCG